MELPTPTIPTDNLYKFQALACLALIIYFLWSFTQRIDAYNAEAMKIEGEAKILLEEAIIAGEDASLLKKVIFNEAPTNVLTSGPQSQVYSNSLSKEPLSHIPISTNPPVNTNGSQLTQVHHEAAEQGSESLRKEVFELEQRVKTQRLKRVELEHRDQMLKHTLDEIARFKLYRGVASGCFFVLMLMAFYRWQTRVQNYQDLILKREAENHAAKSRKRETQEKADGK